MKVKERDPYVVSKATCGGCKYYKSLAGVVCDATMHCSYTLDTGKLKPLDMKCADCTYKVIEHKRKCRKPPKEGWK